jgi:hypothetical protein
MNERQTTQDFHGTPIRLTRRKYGRGTWFCWLEVQLDGEWIDCGDPWPKRTPPAEEIHDAITYARNATEAYPLSTGATTP